LERKLFNEPLEDACCMLKRNVEEEKEEIL
jgi:hypothetical protein